jgi:hypothetical protein
MLKYFTLFAGALKKDEQRATFIIDKYINMKYTSPQMKEQILMNR